MLKQNRGRLKFDFFVECFGYEKNGGFVFDYEEFQEKLENFIQQTAPFELAMNWSIPRTRKFSYMTLRVKQFEVHAEAEEFLCSKQNYGKSKLLENKIKRVKNGNDSLNSLEKSTKREPTAER